MITILIVSDSYHHLRESIEEYVKRLGNKIRLIRITPERSTDPLRIIDHETDRIIVALKKIKGHLYYLDEGGMTFSTENFHAFCIRERQQGGIIFIIGGGYGVDERRLNPYLTGKIRLSDFTLPHGLALFVLLEQLYRINMIERGSKYHH